jgi:hypothetical protein
VTPNLAGADGAIVPQRDVRWVIGDNGVSFVGRVVERHGATTLYRVRAPLRIATASSGVYDDGWIGQDASFARYAAVGRHSGVARLTLSRAGATGSEPRTIVTVRLGTVRVDVNGQPRIGRVRAMRRLSIGGREVKRVELRATPPYRIEVHVARTFRPIDFGGSDARELGVQASSDFVPSPRS